MGERPGAVPLTGTPETKTPLGVLLKPEGAAEHLAQAAVMAPGLAAAGGAGAALGVPAAVGRVAAAGGLGAARAALAGEDATWGGIVDALVAAGTEGAMGLLPHLRLPRMFGVPSLADLAEKMRSTKAGLQYATERLEAALDVVRARLPKGKWLNVPSLSATPLSVQDAVNKLKQATGTVYQQARAEVAHEMGRLDVQRVTGPRPLAGAVFKAQTSPERYVYPGTAAERVAEHVVPYFRAPAVRAAADVAATEEVAPGVPAGAVVPVVAGSELGRIAGAAMRRMMP